MPINNSVKQNNQQQHSAGRETEKHVKEIEKRLLQLDIFNKKSLVLKLQKGTRGHKFFEIAVRDFTFDDGPI
jgi:hypothetical protein